MKGLKKVDAGDIKDTDIVVVLMGPTGSGKSTLIDIATKQNGATVGHGLESETSAIRAVRYKHPDMREDFVLVDTPGFDDTHKPDTEVLKMIATWLRDTYKADKKVTAILYLQRISDNRMPGSPLRNLSMFNQLCGADAMSNVVLVTTMWGKVSEEVGCKREAELMNTIWSGMLGAGASICRFGQTYASAWDVISGAKDKGKNGLVVQQEIVDLERRVSLTSASRAVFKELHALMSKQRETMKKLQEQVNPELVEEFEKEYATLEKRWKETLDEGQKLKISFTRRIWMFFLSKISSLN